MRRTDLVLLRAALVGLLDFLKEVGYTEPPYFCRFLSTMRHNIEICMWGNYEGWERLLVMLKRDWQMAYYGFMGISEYHREVEKQGWDDENSFQLAQLIAEVEVFFPNE